MFGRISRKNGKKRTACGPGAGTSIQVPGIYMKDTFDNQPRTNLRRGLLQKAVTTRDRCVAHMLLRSFRDVRRPRHLPNALNYRYRSISSRWDHENKSRIRRPPNRGGIHILKSSKKQTKNQAFFHSYVPGTCRNPAPPAINSSLFILTWGGVWCRFLVLSRTFASLPLAHPE